MAEPAFKTTTFTDIDGIQTLLIDLLAQGKSGEVVELVVALLQQLKQDNDRLNQRILELMRQRGWQKSEKIPPGQLRLFLEQALATGTGNQETSDVELPSPVERLKRKKSRKSGRRTGRRRLSPDLPREEVVLEPSEDERVCASCQSDKHVIGHERSEVLEYVPASFKVIVYLREKLACRGCSGEVVVGPTGPRPIEGGLPGFGLLADVVVKKYAEHTPLHRMREIYRRLGVDLPVSTLSRWVAVAAESLGPIALAIRRKTLGCHVVQVDDTGLTVLDKSRQGGSKRGHIWAYVGDKIWASYAYTPTREGRGPCTFLADREGWVQADAYSGYDALFRGPDATAIEVGCMAHARRYFVKALESDCRAAIALKWFADLYEVERDAADLTANQRLAMRRDRSAPIMSKLGEWVAATRPAAPPKSPLGAGLTYLVNQWQALNRFLEDGRLEIDNNGCERALRSVALGRNNWLFAGSHEAAERTAVLFTVFATCRLNGVDPWAYLQDIFAKLSSGWRQSRIADLLPPNWARETIAVNDPSAEKRTA